MMAAGFFVRMIVVVFTYRDLPDADKLYERFGWEMGWIARALATGHGFSSPYFPITGPTATQPPFYPFVMSLVFRVTGVYSLTSAFLILAINSLLSACTSIPVYFSAKHVLGEQGAKWAAGLWAFYPFAIYFSANRPWEYALTGLLFTTCFCIAQRMDGSQRLLAWMGWGALVGVTALSNPATLSTFPFLLGLALYRVRRSGRRWLSKGILTTAAAIAVLTPWTVRNYVKVGVLCPVRDNFWLELYDDNFGDMSLDPSFAHPSSNPVEMRKFLAMGEPAFLAEKKILVQSYLHQHPAFFINKTLRRIRYYWTGYWSFSVDELREQPYEPANVFYVSSMTFLMILGIRRMWRQNRSATLPYLALICFFPITYYVTHPLMDYRQPIEPAIAALAVSGAFALKQAEVKKWTEPEIELLPEAE